jgi:hypothetical protein
MQHDEMMQSPIDDETYDLLQTLTSKLEAIDAYQKYEEDATGEARTVFRDMAEQDRENAQRLVELLRERLNTGS